MALFICSNCGYGSASWMGRCPDCGQWNTLEQKSNEKQTGKKKSSSIKLTSLKSVTVKTTSRLSTGIFEFDRVLGGGFIPGEVVLLTGEPGIGKSTLLLQALKHLKTIYVSGEESAEQVKERADRLKIPLENLYFSDELDVEDIVSGIEENQDDMQIIVIDSIQTIYSRKLKSLKTSVSQLKEVTSYLIATAKKNRIPIVIIGHVTKEGTVAGPKTLEHLVDCVLLFEGDKVSHHRILRASKNRFGSTDEIGIFEMKQAGLSQVNNPRAFLESKMQQAPGKVIVGVTEGKRPLFFEIQSLTVPSQLSMPRRVVKGVDYNKVQLIVAVLQKQLNLPLERFDIFVNVVGGVSIRSTAADLGIAASLISSMKNATVSSKTVFIGEVGLLGEVREVGFQERIVQEARRLHFQHVISSEVIKSVKDLRRNFS